MAIHPIQEINPGPTMGQAFGRGLIETFQPQLQRAQLRSEMQEQEREETSKLQQALNGVEAIYTDPNLSPQQKEISLYRALANRPELAQALSQQNFRYEQLNQKNQSEQQKRERELQESRNLLRAIERDRGLEEGALEGYISNPQLAANMTKPEKPATPQQTPFEKQKQTDLAKQYKEDKTQIAKSKDALKNIDRMEELSKGLQGLTGYGKAILNTGEAAEFDALGLAAIEPILKIFNPVGAIPTQKINLIRDKFAPKATDRQTTIEGKLRALRAFNQQAMMRAEQRVNLIDQYQGNPPQDVLNEFDDETESMADAMLDFPISSTAQKQGASSPVQNEQSFDELPDPAQFPNKTIVNQKTGQKMKSDGKKWSPVQ